MSIVRVGLGETAKFAEGYEAIFGKKKPAKKSKATKRKSSSAKKRKARKK
jgi:hypothetical protein